jgi:two-component system, cell cycle sensor histidine kinase and response regulator CckA
MQIALHPAPPDGDPEHQRMLSSIRRFAAIVESSTDGIIGITLDGIITTWNSAAARIYGYAAAEAIGRSLTLLAPPDRVDELLGILARLQRGKRIEGLETVRLRKDGKPIWVSLSAAPFADATGALDGAAASMIVRDISERKQLEEQYRQSQKMEAVGQLAAGVAHDFNNLLSIILGYSELLLAKLPVADPKREPVVQIRQAADRAAGLTRQLLAFGRKQILAPVVLNLNSLMTETEKMLRRLIGADIELTIALQPGLGCVKADPGQVEQIIMNLVVNARDAMPTGGRLTIETHSTVLSELQVRHHAELPPGPYTLLTVIDTGSGMDEATKARIFEPFFTTKDAGKGTGLGLATVFGIIKQSGGFIEVDTVLGTGSTFRTYLPQIREAARLKEADPGLVKMPRGMETILLVEDEDRLRELAQLVLEAIGYKVLSARSGGEAMQVCHDYAGVIHLLFTDVVMPKMSGRQLTDLLVPSHPSMKVLYMSGYTDDTMVRHGIQDEGMNFLPKPFTPVVLAQKVREVLDGVNGHQGATGSGGCPSTAGLVGGS